MRYLPLLACLAALSTLTGCENPAQAYVKQHPELTPEHRKIILAGRIKYGDPVAGMTRDQVRLVMGTDPDQFDKLNGEDAWIWLHGKTGFVRPADGNEADNGGKAKDGGGGRRRTETTDENGAVEPRRGKTTVFFQGNVATRVEFGQTAL